MWGRVLVICGVALVASCKRSPAPSTATAQSTPAAPTGTGKATYELQEKCARDAREWYKHNWEEGPPISGLTTDYTNHYNAKMGKCFMMLQVTSVGKTTADHTNRLTHVLENRDIGVVQWFEGKPPSTCAVHEWACKSTDEWDALVKPYMED